MWKHLRIDFNVPRDLRNFLTVRDQSGNQYKSECANLTEVHVSLWSEALTCSIGLSGSEGRGTSRCWNLWGTWRRCRNCCFHTYQPPPRTVPRCTRAHTHTGTPPVRWCSSHRCRDWTGSCLLTPDTSALSTRGRTCSDAGQTGPRTHPRSYKGWARTHWFPSSHIVWPCCCLSWWTVPPEVWGVSALCRGGTGEECLRSPPAPDSQTAGLQCPGLVPPGRCLLPPWENPVLLQMFRTRSAPACLHPRPWSTWRSGASSSPCWSPQCATLHRWLDPGFQGSPC